MKKSVYSASKRLLAAVCVTFVILIGVWAVLSAKEQQFLPLSLDHVSNTNTLR